MSELPPAVRLQPVGPLAGLRVLDLSGELAVLGPRLLAALGADVVRPEPPSGDVLRHRAPFAPRHNGPGGAVSLAHIVHNGGKRSIIVPPGAAGAAAIQALAAAADIVIAAEDSPFRPVLGPQPADFAAKNPGCALVIVDPFPPTSEYREWQVTDLIISAASGFSWFCGLADGPPEHPKGQLAYSYSGLASAFAAMVGVTARRRTGRAGWFEFSAQEASAFSTLQSADANQYRWYNDLPGRLQWTGTSRRSLQQCADGRWCTFVMLGPHLDALAAWLSEEGLGDQFLGEQWAERDYYLAHAGELTAAITRLCAMYPRDDLIARGQSIRLMVLPVSTATDLLADRHLRERRVFLPVATEAGELLLPRAPTVFSATPASSPRPAPALGADAVAVPRDWVARPAEEHGAPFAAGLPLAGLRVADFSWQLAGPLATRLLGDMGADVVRIESHNRRDMVREVGPQPPGVFSLDTNSTHHNASSNKRSIALDLHHPEAVAVAREIIARSDIVFDNFTPGAMAKWGFDAASLLNVWPHLIVVSQPAVSCTGPHSHWGAIGTGVAGYAGLNGLSGFAENPPFGLGPIVADVIAPFFTMTAVLAALRHRDLTGEGQFLDCGMVEANVWMLDTAIAEAQLTGADPPRTGNRSAWMSPHGFFPCAGADEWVAIAVRSDAEWRNAAKTLGLSGAAGDPPFATFAGRKANESELEQLIATATIQHDRWDIARRLQAAGVPAAALENVADHLERDRGMGGRFTPITHPWGHQFLVQSQFIRPEGATVPNRRAAMLGEQTHEILSELLGKSEAEIEQLVVAGALQ